LKLKIKKSTDLEPAQNGTYEHIGSQGGTEMVARKILERIDPSLLGKFNIIHSRVRDEYLSKDKKNILVLHDTWDDPEVQHMKDPKSRARFAKFVFVSNYSQNMYNMGLGVPYQEGMVIQNAIDPIDVKNEDKDSEQIRIIYHTTPHRGLELLVPVMERLSEIHDNIHLDVFSSFKIYGWEQRDQPYKDLFKRIEDHPQMTYHGFQPNNVVRDALKKAHIYAYPSIWPETSCISVIEAMSAKCHVVCPNLAALPETCANFAFMYGFEEDYNKHAGTFANVLNIVIHEAKTEAMKNKLEFQKAYFDNYYNWDLRTAQWNHFLASL